MSFPVNARIHIPGTDAVLPPEAYFAGMTNINRLVPWIIGAFVVTVCLAAVYLVMQQVERLGADDAADRLVSAVASNADGVMGAAPSDRVDAARSDEVFYVVFDQSGHPIGGDGFIDGKLASPPVGIIRAAYDQGTNRVTWETDGGRRFATVELRSGEQVIMAAQSLAPTEARIDRIGMLVLIIWGLSLVVLAVGAGVHVLLARPRSQP